MILNYELFKGFTVGALILTVSVLFAVIFIAKYTSVRLRRMLKDKLSKEQMSFMLKIINYGIIFLYIIFILSYFGVNFSGLMVAGGIAGIVLGFASQRIVGNFVSGVFLLIERPIKIGSDVNLEGYGGFVEDINVMSTIIRTYDGLYLRLPNEKVFMSNIVNNVENKARRLDFLIGIDFSSDINLAINILDNIASAHPLVLALPKPEIFFDKNSDSASEIMIRVWSPTHFWWEMKKDIMNIMIKSLEDAGIILPYPQRVIWIKNS